MLEIFDEMSNANVVMAIMTEYAMGIMHYHINCPRDADQFRCKFTHCKNVSFVRLATADHKRLLPALTAMTTTTLIQYSNGK